MTGWGPRREGRADKDLEGKAGQGHVKSGLPPAVPARKNFLARRPGGTYPHPVGRRVETPTDG